MTKINDKKTKRKNVKGFTLVELIVVMIILAILAALLVPSMTGYIDKANNNAAIVEARQVLVACQTIASENYFHGSVWDAADTAEAKTLSEVTGTISDVKVASGKIDEFKYVTESGITVTYNQGAADKFTVS